MIIIEYSGAFANSIKERSMFRIIRIALLLLAFAVVLAAIAACTDDKNTSSGVSDVSSRHVSSENVPYTSSVSDGSGTSMPPDDGVSR